MLICKIYYLRLNFWLQRTHVTVNALLLHFINEFKITRIYPEYLWSNIWTMICFDATNSKSIFEDN